MTRFQHRDVSETQRVLTNHGDDDTPQPEGGGRGGGRGGPSCVGDVGCRSGNDGRGGKWGGGHGRVGADRREVWVESGGCRGGREQNEQMSGLL